MDSLKEEAIQSIRRNPKLDLESMRSVYRGDRRLHIHNFLIAEDAHRLYECLEREVNWKPLLIANGEVFTISLGPDQASNERADRELTAMAHESVDKGFVSFFETNRLLWGNQEREDEGESDGRLLEELWSFINSESFLSLCRRVTGIENINRADGRCARFRKGHFVTFNGALPSSESKDCRLIYSLGLTPAWRPEWGGLLEFRNCDDNLINAVQPCFNTLDLFAFPLGHWVSVISAFAGGARLSISGHVYADED